MRDQLQDIKNWSKNNHRMALARVIHTWGSSPRPVGSSMFMNEDGAMSGSVSGGCVEGAVVKKAKESMEDHSARKLVYGVTDDEAWSVGLACGGSIQVFVQEFDLKSEVWSKLQSCLEGNKYAILISSIEDGNNTNTLISEDGTLGDQIPDELAQISKEAYDQRSNKMVELEGKTYFVHIFPRKSILLIIGVAHITVDLVKLANWYGFETVVIDPRGYFTKNITFKEGPSQMIESYPSEVLEQFPLDAYTYAAILSHDPKIDDNALEILLKNKIAYIGALGSKKTHAKRTARLLENGFSQEQIDTIHAPIGLSIGAKGANEIALAIMGQILEVKNIGARN